jgi:outer membrane biosynthesis protein TonB
VRRSDEQRSNLALLAASLLAHAILLLMFPGIAIPHVKPPVLLIELSPEISAKRARHEPASRPVQGLEPEVPGGIGARSLEPQDGQAAVRKSAPGSNLSPARPTGAAGAAVPKNGPATPNGPVAPVIPGPSSDATDVANPQPRVVPNSPQSVPVPPKHDTPKQDTAKPAPPAAQPDAPPQSRPADKPSQPDAQPQGRPDQQGAPGVGKPGPETRKPDNTPNKGNGSGPSPDPGDGSGNTPGAPDNNGPEGRTAPDFGTPAIPAGPGAGELAILGSYGDHCMEEIRKQARNPERAREQFKDKKDNWGTVSFEFEVSKSGKLLDVRVISDGGFAPFGQEVEEATRVASRYFGGWSKYGTVASVESWTFKRKLKFPLY